MARTRRTKKQIEEDNKALESQALENQSVLPEEETGVDIGEELPPFDNEATEGEPVDELPPFESEETEGKDPGNWTKEIFPPSKDEAPPFEVEDMSRTFPDELDKIMPFPKGYSDATSVFIPLDTKAKNIVPLDGPLPEFDFKSELKKVEEKPAFEITDDKKAEWALRHIRELTADHDRLTGTCTEMMNEYKFKIIDYDKKLESDTLFFKNQLEHYFESVTHKKAKTQESYQLPGGKLIRKYGKTDFDIDSEALIKNGLDEAFIKTTKTVKWAEYKETLTAKGSYFVDEHGEIITDIKIIEKPDTFKIDIK